MPRRSGISARHFLSSAQSVAQSLRMHMQLCRCGRGGAGGDEGRKSLEEMYVRGLGERAENSAYHLARVRGGSRGQQCQQLRITGVEHGAVLERVIRCGIQSLRSKSPRAADTGDGRPLHETSTHTGGA